MQLQLLQSRQEQTPMYLQTMWHTGNGAAVLEPGEARLRNAGGFALQSGSFIHHHRHRAASARDGRRNCSTNPKIRRWPRVIPHSLEAVRQVAAGDIELSGDDRQSEEESHRKPAGWRMFRQLLPRWPRRTCTSRRQTAERVRWPAPGPASAGSARPHWSADGRLCTKWWLGQKGEEMGKMTRW